MRVEHSIYVSDIDIISRTWKERLFTFPWTPWKSTKAIYSPKVYFTPTTIICSPRTYDKLMLACPDDLTLVEYISGVSSTKRGY